VIYRYPEPLPRWILPKKKSQPFAKARPGKPPQVGTNNVLFSSQLVREDGLGLRFNPRLNLTGGEDTDFFIKAWERGAHIVDSEAAVFEEVPPERCTYWRQVRRQYQYAVGDTIPALDRGRPLSVALQALGRLFSATGSLIAAIVLGVFSGRRFKKYALRGGGKLMYAAGQISVLAGYRHEGYRVIDGQ
jgi:succinoglycan biosynthesis protein ExoM